MLDDFDMDFPEEDEDFDFEDESSDEAPGRNRTFILIAGGLGVLIILGILVVGGFFLLRGRLGGDQASAPTATITLPATFTAVVTNTEAPTETLVPSDTPMPSSTNAAIPDAGGDAGGPTPDPRTATVEALLTQAALAQTQAAAQLLTQSPTPTPTATGLPDTGIMDDLGAPTMLAIAGLLILVIFIARRLRAATV